VVSRYGLAAGALDPAAIAAVAALLEQPLASLLAFSFKERGQVAHIAWLGKEIPFLRQTSPTASPHEAASQQLGHRIQLIHFDFKSVLWPGVLAGWPATRRPPDPSSA